MRVWVLCGLSGCGAAIYFPVEPGPRHDAPPTLETAVTGDTGVPPDTDPPVNTLGDEAAEWGTYYEHGPLVVAGHLPQALRHLVARHDQGAR